MSHKLVKRLILPLATLALCALMLTGCGDSTGNDLESEIELTDASTNIFGIDDIVSDDGSTANSDIIDLDEIFIQPENVTELPEVLIDPNAKTEPEIFANGSFEAQALYLTPDTTEKVTVALIIQNDEIVDTQIKSSNLHPNTKAYTTEDILAAYQLQITDKNGVGIEAIPESPHIFHGLEKAVGMALENSKTQFKEDAANALEELED